MGKPPAPPAPIGYTAKPKKQNYTPELFAKNSIFNRKDNFSLDALLESPKCDESEFKPVERDIYKKAKRTINRNNPKHAAIPTMQQLWDAIDSLDNWYNSVKDTHDQAWLIRRWNIELKQQQYLLLESALPNIVAPYSKGTINSKFLPWYDGIILKSGIRVFLDLSNPHHVEAILNEYSKLRKYAWQEPDADINYILDELETAIDQAKLQPSRRDILIWRIDGVPMAEIAKRLTALYGQQYNYSPNYLSTIFTQQICSRIALSALNLIQQREYADDPTKWRTCIVCHERKILSPYNFIRRSSHIGGYSIRCKDCEKGNYEQ